MYGMTNIVMPVAQVDPAQIENVDLTMATRDALKAIGYKQKWLKPKEVVAQKQQQNAEAAKIAKGSDALMSVGAIGEQAGNAAIALKEGLGEGDEAGGQ